MAGRYDLDTSLHGTERAPIFRPVIRDNEKDPFEPIRVSLSEVNFNHFLNDSEPAARDRFENFTLALVSAVRSNVRGMRAAPGDWGIDAFIGDLSDSIAIWQAKFFPREVDSSQQAQIRDSYASAKKAGAEYGHTIISWTLVLPCELSAPERVWWDGWAAKQKRDDGIEIELWELAKLRELLRSPDAADVRAEYFRHLDSVHPPEPPAVRESPPGAVSPDMLFIKQLQAAGLTELEVASEEFYNAEILERDLADKRLERQMRAYAGLRSDLHSTWADRYGHHCSTGDGTQELLPALHGDVMERIDADHRSSPMLPLPLTRTHRKGVMHQVVDAGKAGWTRSYRTIAEEHKG
jgi:hypothetical protein